MNCSFTPWSPTILRPSRRPLPFPSRPKGVTTGISAADRATTILAAIADDAKPEDLVRPGHVFPLRAKKGGRFGSDRANRRFRGPGPSGRAEARRGHL